MKRLFFGYSLILTLLFQGEPVAMAQMAKDMDLAKLKSGSLVEGSLSGRNETHVTMECVGGRVLLPINSIESLTEATPGESELVLGLELVKRKKYDRAKEFLDKATKYTQWAKDAQNALKTLDQELEAMAAQQREKELKNIENLIERRGINAGIEALQRRSKEDEEYWGSYRGKMHLIMAKERLEHLDIKGAERHLTMADKYGVDPAAWDEVRQKIVDMRSKSYIFGKDAVAILPKKLQRKPGMKTVTGNWLASVESARRRGEKVPPMVYLQHVEQYAQANNLDPLLIWAIIDTESSWQPKVISNKGAQGLMQLMPGTAEDLEVSDPFNPEENIRGGTEYMRFLMAMFNDVDKALAAYNMGPGTIGRSKGIPEAGQRYITKVKTRLAALQERYGTIASAIRTRG